MIAIDTNVLVRVLIDEPSQAAHITAARALVADAGNVFVSQVVLIETVWVLESAYQLPKAEVLRALDGLQTTYGVPLATPANWEVGQDVVVALSLTDEQAVDKYGDIDIKLPYLRMTSLTK